MDLETSFKSADNSYDGDDDNDKMLLLLNNVPILKDIFQIHYKVGEGTFSSVFLATLKNSERSKSFAIKHLVPTCHPGRIERELQCLKDIGGQDHVVGLELCLRNAGSVVFVMPYLRHEKFSDYVFNMSSEEMKEYMKALLTALKRVHQFNIIHRDIKPSNFLYDRTNKRYLLVDFGLAQEYIKNENSSRSETLHTNLVKEKKPDENKSDGTLKVASRSVEKCYCFGKPRVCSLCLLRPPQNAPRAGTPGFRAPEVLLKHKDQTPAIDIWACGVIMLSILSGTQPFFRSPDDMTALAEITTLFGSSAMQQLSKKLGKKLIYHEDIPSSDIISICKKLKKRKTLKHTELEKNIEKTEITYPDEAYNLLKKLLDIDYKTRITAEKALLHPFFS